MAWITRDCAQYIHYSPEGKIEVVVEIYLQRWAETLPSHPDFGSAKGQREQEMDTVLNPYMRPVYELPDRNGAIAYFRLPHQMNRTLEEDAVLPEALWPENLGF